jgi:hypothetical protein
MAGRTLTDEQKKILAEAEPAFTKLFNETQAKLRAAGLRRLPEEGPGLLCHWCMCPGFAPSGSGPRCANCPHPFISHNVWGDLT